MGISGSFDLKIWLGSLRRATTCLLGLVPEEVVSIEGGADNSLLGGSTDNILKCELLLLPPRSDDGLTNPDLKMNTMKLLYRFQEIKDYICGEDECLYIMSIENKSEVCVCARAYI